MGPSLKKNRIAGLKLLIGESNQDSASSITKLLMGAGAEVSGTGAGDEILRKIQQQKYDAVLLDLNLAGIDGHELCRQIRSSGRKVPVILYASEATSHASHSLALEAGADAFLTAPMEVEHLFAVIAGTIVKNRS